jgi:uncharacterized protein YecA (UPF0149 family)
MRARLMACNNFGRCCFCYCQFTDTRVSRECPVSGRLFGIAYVRLETDRFQLTFYERKFEDKKILIVDAWCFGFLKGIRLDSPGWKALKKDRPDLLKSLQLFGSPAGWKEIDGSGDPALMHKRWSSKITPTVRAIHRYWLAARGARYGAESGERVH